MSKSKLITLTIFTYVLLLPVFLSAGTFKLPDTGQTKCYRGVDPYDEIPCAGTGQDGAYVQNPLSYTDNGNGTVTDNNTGLVWQQQDDGPGYNWYVASGIYDATQNPESMDVCGSLDLGGATDWRLPTKKELMSIVDYAIPFPGPTNNTAYFQNRRGSNDWSSTTVAGDPDSAMHVNFEIGGVYSDYKFYGLSVRCVRGGQSPSSPLIDNGNGTVTDSRTSLIWQQGETELMSWGAALSYCEGLNLGGSTAWRLPNIKELESLTDDTQSNPSIDTSMFPNTYASGYWSSTTNAYYSDNTWFVGFSNGGVWIYPKNNEYTTLNIRCVRGGLDEPAPTHGNLEISPPSHDFGEVSVGQAPILQGFILKNTGDAEINISNIYLSDSTDLSLDTSGVIYPCSINNHILQPGDLCNILVKYIPSQAGTINSNLVIESNDPDTPSLEVPLTGTATAKGWVVVIDGVHILSIFSPSYPPDFSDYLKDAIDVYWTGLIEERVGTIIPFIWSRNIYDTGDYVKELSNRLETLTNFNKQTNSPLVILSHSWGTVLAYLAISQNSNIHVDKFISLGSPLNSQNPIVNDFTKLYVERVEQPSNVERWHNYWAKCDPISGDIRAANRNSKIKTDYIDNPIGTCHAAYFDDYDVWQKILLDVYVTKLPK